MYQPNIKILEDRNQDISFNLTPSSLKLEIGFWRWKTKRFLICIACARTTTCKPNHTMRHSFAESQ